MGHLVGWMLSITCMRSRLAIGEGVRLLQRTDSVGTPVSDLRDHHLDEMPRWLLGGTLRIARSPRTSSAALASALTVPHLLGSRGSRFLRDCPHEPSASRTRTPARAAQGRPADRPARRARRDRPQHDRLRVRRPAAGRRLRRAVPRGAPARRRRDPARLHLDPGPARRHRGDRAHPRPRGPHRRRPLPAARAPGHPAGRVAADAGVHRRQAQGAPDHPGHRAGRRGRPPHRSAPFDCEFVAVNHSIPDGLAVAIRTAAGHGPAHRRLQDGPVPPGPAGSPTCAPSPGSARRASTCS